jgi:CRP/FNR family transcriptional regulator, cyclic AMP receptor protein
MRPLDAARPRRHDRCWSAHKGESQVDQKAVVELLGRTALFGSLDSQDRTAIAGRMRKVQFEPDQMIFSRGDPGREVYLVIEGRIRLSVLTNDGRELSFDRAGPGHIFGEIATFDGGERTAGATAVSRVQALSLPQKALMELIENNPKVAIAAIRFLCQRLRETDQKLEAIALHRIEVRLARLMLSAIKLQATTPNEGKVKLDLDMSQSELALLIGASRPKVNIALAMLEDMGAITKAGAAYLCNIEVLEEVAEAE